jgi:exosortase/archaeosortase family protein
MRKLGEHFRAGRSSLSLASTRLRAGLLLALAALAYHYSLASLFAEWRYQTPIAYLGLVPLLAAALFLLALLRHGHVAAIAPARRDLLLGLPGLALSFFVLAAGPALAGNYFWPLRLDLLTLPLFVASACALLFGLRSLVFFLYPILFSLLAWPLPYTVLLEQALAWFTELTSRVASALATSLGLAQSVPGSGGGRLLVEHAGEQFVLVVGSACSGFNSAVGFLLIGAAALPLLEGAWRRRLLWLAVGLAAVWAFNLLRVLCLIATADLFGERAAVELLHPVAGIVALNLAALGMLACLPWFGLRLHPLRGPRASDTPIVWPASAAELASGERRLRRRLPLLVGVALAFALADAQLAPLATFYENSGRPAIVSFAADPDLGPGWRVDKLQTFEWSKPYFGPDSSWQRFYARALAGHLPARERFTVWVDSIVTPELGALRAYPVRRCYEFHDYAILSDRRVSLAGGLSGQLLVYRNQSGAVWHVLTWQWPVLTSEGARVEHERVVMFASSMAEPLQPTQPAGPWTFADGVRQALNALGRDDDPNDRLSAALLGLADRMVAARSQVTQR